MLESYVNQSTSSNKNTTSPDITYGDFVIVPSGNVILKCPYTDILLSKAVIISFIIPSIASSFPSLWHVPRHHLTIIGLRCPIHWIEKCNYHRVHHIPNRYIFNISYPSTFSCNGCNHIWLLVVSWCEHCSDTPNDNR